MCDSSLCRDAYAMKIIDLDITNVYTVYTDYAAINQKDIGMIKHDALDNI